jgi:hypothetical protein
LPIFEIPKAACNREFNRLRFLMNFDLERLVVTLPGEMEEKMETEKIIMAAAGKPAPRRPLKGPDVRHQVLVVVSIFFFLLCLLIQSGIAASPSWPPEQPIPRIETGMHTAPIWRISVDAQERFLVTASKDKTARVWDLANGKLLKILRVPMGAGPSEGQLFCVAISPDGATIALGGYTGVKSLNRFNIYIYDRASGQIKQVIPGLPAEIGYLIFSRDGQYLAATLVGEQGLRVYQWFPNQDKWSEVFKDKRYGDDSYWADFGPSPQNRLITTSYDGCLRLYKPQDGKYGPPLKPLIKHCKNGALPATARFSPDGSLLAVGFISSHRVRVFSGETLTPLPDEPNLKGTGKGHLARVAWSRKGDLLYAGGGAAKAGVYQILAWTQAGRGSVTSFPASFSSIMDLYPLEGGRLVFAAADPAFGILDASGHRVLAKIPNTPDFQNEQKNFRISKDGRVVEFGFTLQDSDLTQKHYLARLNTKTRQFTLLDPSSKPMDQELQPPNTAGFKDSDWENAKPHTNPKFRGVYDPRTKSYSLARIPQGRGFILGTDWELLFFAENGKPLFHKGKNYEPEGKVIFLPGSAYGLSVSGDGQVAVVALGDGSLRWYHIKDGKEILAFLRHRDGNWVMWSPEGFFTCSPAGGKLLGYHLNQGPDKTPRFVTSNQLYDQFYRNDLVDCHLKETPKNQVQAALPHGSAQQVLADSPPPTVEIVSKKKLNECDYLYEVKITDRGGGIGQFVYRLNGVDIKPTISRMEDLPDMPGLTRSIPTTGAGDAENAGRRLFIPVTFEPGVEQSTSFSAFNKQNTAESAPATDTMNVPGKTLHSLYVLSIGVTDYQGQYPKLPFAAPDAEKLAIELKTRGKGVFQSVIPISLVNKDATLKKIKAAFKDLKDKIKPDDVFIVILAGHGSLENGRYNFIPYNGDSSKQELLSQKKLNDLLKLIPAWRSLVILDTCHAGAFAASKEGNELRHNLEDTAFSRLCNVSRRATIASCCDSQVALEGYKGHGVFTYVLLQGLKGEADLKCNGGDGNYLITLIELYMYLRARVPEITSHWHYQQRPWIDLRGQEELNIAARARTHD